MAAAAAAGTAVVWGIGGLPAEEYSQAHHCPNPKPVAANLTVAAAAVAVEQTLEAYKQAFQLKAHMQTQVEALAFQNQKLA